MKCTVPVFIHFKRCVTTPDIMTDTAPSSEVYLICKMYLSWLYPGLHVIDCQYTDRRIIGLSLRFCFSEERLMVKFYPSVGVETSVMTSSSFMLSSRSMTPALRHHLPSAQPRGLIRRDDVITQLGSNPGPFEY
jgi:hypothetical protein